MRFSLQYRIHTTNYLDSKYIKIIKELLKGKIEKVHSHMFDWFE
jgi:hypothetical protein